MTEDPEIAALIGLRDLCREFGWTPQQALSAPARLVRDFATVRRYERQLRPPGG